MDLFIAATALEAELTLVTRNMRHFARIPELTLYLPN
jgi:predicted nucleic acid-binding protein